MKIDRPKFHQSYLQRIFKIFFMKKIQQVCEIIDSTFENESVDRVRLYDTVIKTVSLLIQTLAILILQMFVLKTVIYQMLI